MKQKAFSCKLVGNYKYNLINQFIGDISTRHDFLKSDFSFYSKKAIAMTFLTSGSLAWLFLLQIYFIDVLKESMPEYIWVEIGKILYYGFAIVSAIVGSYIAPRTNRKKLIFVWIISGITATAFLVFLTNTLNCLIISPFLGFSLGLGLPSSMAILADHTTIDQRGRIAGITILQTFIMAFLAIVIVTVLKSQIPMAIPIAIVLMILVRSTSFLFYSLDEKKFNTETKNHFLKKTPYKEFAFYIFPWIMFVIAAGLANNIIPQEGKFIEASNTGTTLRMGLLAIFGVIWGIITDRIGRKTPIIIGLTVLGVGFGLLGLSMTPNNVIIYLASSGIAWASFLTVYLVIPGDLSPQGAREKTYALGTISPLIIWFSLAMIDTANFTGTSTSSFSQILSIILFFSIIPVIRARETLQEAKIKKRKMKEHAQKVGKLIKDFKNYD